LTPPFSIRPYDQAKSLFDIKMDLLHDTYENFL
jgi:hypothetical protein